MMSFFLWSHPFKRKMKKSTCSASLRNQLVWENDTVILGSPKMYLPNLLWFEDTFLQRHKRNPNLKKNTGYGHMELCVYKYPRYIIYSYTIYISYKYTFVYHHHITPLSFAHPNITSFKNSYPQGLQVPIAIGLHTYPQKGQQVSYRVEVPTGWVKNKAFQGCFFVFKECYIIQEV